MNFKLWRTVGVIKDVRRGSALLVVLGMLAFMLFSGLAFSVYMRQSRLPTSFLRRTATTRQLTKAALAEAIDHIDRAIGNDPHPGLHLSSDGEQEFDEDRIYNLWHHRVFFGLGEKRSPANASEPRIKVKGEVICPQQADTDETAPTLTLEGIAYLPPNLINEARYYSQRTPTAKWHSFWFDSGRYAYTAIDVSDYFDVNRVFANKPRAACASRRLSLAHLFEDGADHSGPGDGGDGWKTFMANYREGDDDMKNDRISYNEYPFVSMADFNIAWGSQDIGGLRCPFYHFVKNTVPYDCGQGANDADAEKYRNMTFVTDGWFPTTTGNTTPNTNREKRDLTAYQPFRDADLNGQTMPELSGTVLKYKSEIVNAGGSGADLTQHLCLLGLAQLWDYLDVNRVPVSLAVPTLEQVPMVVGVEPLGIPNLVIEKKENEDNDGKDKVEEVPAQTRTSTRTIAFRISPKLMVQNGSIGVRAVLAYPFNIHGGSVENDSFTVDGRMEVFFSNDQMGLRAGSAVEALRLTKNDQKEMQGAGILNNAVISIPLDPTSVSAKNIVEKGYAMPMVLTGNKGKLGAAGDVTVLAVTYKWISEEWDAKANNGEGGWTTGGPLKAHTEPVAGDIEAATCGFWPLTKDGSCNTMSDDKVKELLKSGKSLSEARVNVSVRVRVKYNDEFFGEKTVDLVPACSEDDEALNGVNSGSMGYTIGGEGFPLMRFDARIGANAAETLSFSIAGFEAAAKQPQTITLPSDGVKQVVVNDPRYNHQPENWYKPASGDGLDEKVWIAETAKMLNQDGRDSDFYLFTSDQGHMQSVYELAYLPRLTGLSYATKGDGIFGSYKVALPTRTSFAATLSEAKDYDVMWRTYRCYDDPKDPDTYPADPFEEIGLTCGENGPKVNPYSGVTAVPNAGSIKVLMAAFANTPHDWRVSSTNNEEVAELPAKTFNAKHAWNDYSSDPKGKMCWDCLEAVAREFQAKVYKSGNWEDAFAELRWSADERKILDFEEVKPEEEETDSPLHAVDKKFLYGFWHDCFAARQQLYLIFVRAEPMMMGGGVKGQIPPQLGARAVALVWRDPTATKVDRTVEGQGGQKIPNPHRTRILFYHQFD